MSKKATIEIKSHTVEKFKNIDLLDKYQHLYLIYTKANGEQLILRGGPEFDNPVGIDELFIIHENYATSSYDQDPNNSHPRATLVEGNEEALDTIWNSMWQRGNQINKEKYDYEILTQNSNTVVIQMAKSVNLDNDVLTFIQENNLVVPAYDATLRHDPIDRTYDIYEELKQTIETACGSIEKFRDRLEVNAYIWLYKIAKALSYSLQELLKSKVKELIDQLLKPIDPLKPVIVIQESDTGRNELFIDQLTGQLMTREEFSDLIASEHYPGYTVAIMEGLETPMSKADGSLSNNLG